MREKKSMLVGESMTIRGIVVELDSDDDGNPVTVAVSVPVGVEEVMEPEEVVMEEMTEEYIVAGIGKGKALLELVDSHVEVTGVVMKNNEGDNTIIVKSYRVVN